MMTVTTVDRRRGSDSIAQVNASVWLMNSVMVESTLRPCCALRHHRFGN
jgi:hypothetical protein